MNVLFPTQPVPLLDSTIKDIVIDLKFKLPSTLYTIHRSILQHVHFIICSKCDKLYYQKGTRVIYSLISTNVTLGTPVKSIRTHVQNHYNKDLLQRHRL